MEEKEKYLKVLEGFSRSLVSIIDAAKEIGEAGESERVLLEIIRLQFDIAKEAYRVKSGS